MEAESLSGARTVKCLEWRANIPMTSTNQLPLSVLQLAYDFGIGLEIALIAFYSSVQLVEPVSCLKPTYSCSPTFLLSRSLANFLGGGLVIGSIIASMQWFALQGYTIPLMGMVAIMLVVLLAAGFLKLRHDRSSNHDISDRCPNLSETHMSNLDELPEAPAPEDLRTLQQNWLPIELYQAPTFQDGDLKAVIQEITAATSDTLTISYRIRRHTDEDISYEGSATGIRHLDSNVLPDIVAVPHNLMKHQQPESVRPKANLNPLDSELRLYRTSLLFKLTNQIRSSLEADTILETAVESIRTLLHIDRCYVIWYKPDEIAPSWEVVNEAKTSLVKSHIGSYSIERLGLLGERLLKGKTLKIDDVETLCNFDLQESLLSLGYKSLLSIPIETKQGEIGAINCVQCSRYRLWEDNEVELLQALVEQLVVALDQAALYAQARQAAAEAKAQTKQLKLTLNQLKTAQSQLVQNAKMSSLGQLVAGIAHEINNPVNFIHGNLTYASAYIHDLVSYVRLYQEQYPNPTPAIAERAEVIDIDFITNDLPKLLRSMRIGTDRIRSIVLSLRNFSRLDEANIKEANLHEGIDSTLLVLQHRLKGKGTKPAIKVVKEYGYLPPIKCFPGDLNQAFANILNNAIESFDQPGVKPENYASPVITIRTQLLDSTDPTQKSLSRIKEWPTHNGHNYQSIAIQIIDNGAGMIESIKSQIFDPFFTTKPVGQGTGLGLSICHQIVVEQHHGVLLCNSVPGQGSEFWIEIPIAPLV